MADGDITDQTGDGGVDPDVEHETWRQLLFWAALAELCVCITVLAVNGAVIPPVIVFGVLFLVGLLLLRRPGKAGPIMIGILCVLFLLSNLSFVISDLSHPESFLGFFPAAVGILAALLGSISLVGFVRRWSVVAAARSSAVVGVLVVLALAVGLVKTLTLTDDSPRDGDVVLEAQDVEFAPAELTAPSGGVAVFVSNQDPYRHTFTIDDLDVNVELPAATDRRVVFDADPGEYTYYCDVPGHEDMEGTLTVE